MLRKQEVEIMNKLKDAIKSGKKLEKRSQPAVVIENKEPPDIPEMVIGEMVESSFTGEDAVRYLARLSLGRWREREREEGRGKKGEGEGGGVEDGRSGEVEEEGESGRKVEGEMEGGAGGGAESEEEKERDGVSREGEGKEMAEEDGGEGRVIESVEVDAATESATNPTGADTDRVKKKRKKKKKKKAQPHPPSPAEPLSMEEQLAAAYREIERNTRIVVQEAAEALNRNEIPVRREMKAYVIPGNRGGVVPPPNRTPPRHHQATPTDAKPLPTPRTAKHTTRPPAEGSKDSGNPLPISRKGLRDGPSEAASTSDEATPTSHEGTPTFDEATTNSDSIPTSDEATPTLDGDAEADAPISDKATSTSSESPTSDSSTNDATPTNNGSATPTDNETLTNNTTGDAPPTSQAPPTKGTPIKRPRPPKNRKTRDEAREEEIKKRFPGYRSWPTQEECDEKPLPKTVVFTSTWLSVTAKGIK